MPKKNIKYSRQEQIIKLLADKQLLTSQDFAHRLDVDVRTIQRDLKELMHSESFAIERNDAGQYYFTDGYNVENSSWDIDELIILDLALKQIKDSDGSFEHVANRILNKMLDTKYVNPYYIKSQELEKVHMNSADESKLKDAIEENQILQIKYVDADVTIEPYKITNFDGIWYLFAKDTQQEKIKTYMLSKIDHIRFTNKKFEVLENIDILLGGVHSAWFNDGNSFEVVIKVYAEVADFFKLRKHLSSQKILKTFADGSLHVSFEISHNEDLDNLVKSWLPHIEVISPLRFRERISRELRQYLKNIEKD